MDRGTILDIRVGSGDHGEVLDGSVDPQGTRGEVLDRSINFLGGPGRVGGPTGEDRDGSGDPRVGPRRVERP